MLVLLPQGAVLARDISVSAGSSSDFSSTASGPSTSETHLNRARSGEDGRDGILADELDQFAFKSTPAKLEVLRSLLLAYPESTRLDTVSDGGGVGVYALVLSERALSRAFLVPRVQLSAAFPAGAGMLLRFAHHLLEARNTDAEVAALLENTELHLVFHLAGYRSNSFHQVCVSETGSDLVRLLNLDASVNDEAAAADSAVLSQGSGGGNRLVLSGVLLTDVPAVEEPDGPPKAPDQDVFMHIASSFIANQPGLANLTCGDGGDGFASNRPKPTSAGRRSPTLGALEKHAYAHRGMLQSFLPVACCSNVTKLRALWPEIRNALFDFALKPSEGVRGYIKDVRGTLVQHALLTVRGRPVGFWSSDQGEFWRILRPGDYMLLASAAGYLPAAARFTVAAGQRWGPPVVLTLHFAPRALPVLQMAPPTVLSRTKNGTSPGKRSPPQQPSKAGLPSSSSTASDAGLCLLRLLVWALLVGERFSAANAYL